MRSAALLILILLASFAMAGESVPAVGYTEDDYPIVGASPLELARVVDNARECLPKGAYIRYIAMRKHYVLLATSTKINGKWMVGATYQLTLTGGPCTITCAAMADTLSAIGMAPQEVRTLLDQLTPGLRYLNVTVGSTESISVMSGVQDGPLSGSGVVYYYSMGKQKKWILIEKAQWIS